MLLDPDPDAEAPVWRGPSGGSLADLGDEPSPSEQNKQMQAKARSSLARAPGATSAHAGRAAAREKERVELARLVQLRAALMATSAEDKARLLTADRLVALGHRGPPREFQLLLTHAPPDAIAQACARDTGIQRSVRERRMGGGDAPRGGMLCAGSLARLPEVTDASRPALAAVLDIPSDQPPRALRRRLGLVASLAAVAVAVGLVCGAGNATSPPPPACAWAWGKGCVPANGATRRCKFVPYRLPSPCVAASLA